MKKLSSSASGFQEEIDIDIASGFVQQQVVTLSSEEQKDLLYRSFFVKDLSASKLSIFFVYCLVIGLIISVGLPIVMFFQDIIFYPEDIWEFIFSYLFAFVPILWVYISILSNYMLSNKIFYYGEGKIMNAKDIYTSGKTRTSKQKVYKNVFDPRRLGFGGYVLLTLVISFLLFFVTNSLQQYFLLIQTSAYSYITSLELGFLISFTVIFFFIVAYTMVYYIESINPIYAFGNLGEKIQKLTPKIEEKSGEIQKNFQSDMNFSILSEGFDSLSTIFSEIIALVIKLEKLEKWANKGNLFDSIKYINSLRSDIVEPLISLKSFLEKQREQLAVTVQELQKVRIGKQTEFSSGSDLSSKRSESLLTELTENIGKLDQMIGKMEEKK